MSGARNISATRSDNGSYARAHNSGVYLSQAAGIRDFNAATKYSINNGQPNGRDGKLPGIEAYERDGPHADMVQRKGGTKHSFAEIPDFCAAGTHLNK